MIIDDEIMRMSGCKVIVAMAVRLASFPAFMSVRMVTVMGMQMLMLFSIMNMLQHHRIIGMESVGTNVKIKIVVTKTASQTADGALFFYDRNFIAVFR